LSTAARAAHGSHRAHLPSAACPCAWHTDGVAHYCASVCCRQGSLWFARERAAHARRCTRCAAFLRLRVLAAGPVRPGTAEWAVLAPLLRAAQVDQPCLYRCRT
jgi:hypothetical protein